MTTFWPATWAGFMRDYQALIGVVVAGLFSAIIAVSVQVWQSARERRSKRALLAASWAAVIIELALALDRMQETARHLILSRVPNKDENRSHKSDMLLHAKLREEFFLRSDDASVVSIAMSIYQDLHLFNWNVAQGNQARIQWRSDPNRSGPQRALWEYVDAAIWFASCRHGKMVVNWMRCQRAYEAYCNSNRLKMIKRPKTPSIIPFKWRKRETRDLGMKWIDSLPRPKESSWE